MARARCFSPTREVKARVHRTDRHAGGGGDRAARLALKLEQDERDAMLGRQGLQRRVQSQHLAIERDADLGRRSEIARVVACLASPAASDCQGAFLDVDGGPTRTL